MDRLRLYEATAEIDIPINVWVDQDTCNTVGNKREDRTIHIVAHTKELAEALAAYQFDYGRRNASNIRIKEISGPVYVLHVTASNHM